MTIIVRAGALRFIICSDGVIASSIFGSSSGFSATFNGGDDSEEIFEGVGVPNPNKLPFAKTLKTLSSILLSDSGSLVSCAEIGSYGEDRLSSIGLIGLFCYNRLVVVANLGLGGCLSVKL